MFCVSELDQFPEVLVDLIKLYVEPELRLAEIGIACTDPEISDADYVSRWYAKDDIADTYRIFSKKWTKIFANGEIWVCDPKKYIGDFDEKKHIGEMYESLSRFSYVDECNFCDKKMSDFDEIFVASGAVHMMNDVELDERLFCADCGPETFHIDKLLNLSTLFMKFQTEVKSVLITKEMKIHVFEPYDCPLTACHILTKTSGFTVTKYLLGNTNQLIQTSDGTVALKWMQELEFTLGLSSKK